MALLHVWRCLSYLSLVVIAGLFITGCVIREPAGITELGLARKALDDARRAGKADCAPTQFADLERRFLQARGVYYACNDAEAIRLARALAADANALGCPQPAVANRPPVCRLTVHRRRGRWARPWRWMHQGRLTPMAIRCPSPGILAMAHRLPRPTSHAHHAYLRQDWWLCGESHGGRRARWYLHCHGTETIVQKIVLTETAGKVLFDFNKAILKPEAKNQLARVLQVLKDQPGAQVDIAGHTDSVGSDAYNMRLGKRRADAVASLPGNRTACPGQNIRTESFGKRKPIASNATAEGRAQNRRVEITLSPRS